MNICIRALPRWSSSGCATTSWSDPWRSSRASSRTVLCYYCYCYRYYYYYYYARLVILYYTILYYTISYLHHNKVQGGGLPMDMRFPPLRIRIMPESNPPKSRVLVRRLAIERLAASKDLEDSANICVYVCIYIYIYIYNIHLHIYIYIYI